MVACGDSGGSPAVVLLMPEVEVGEILEGEGLALCIVDGEGTGGVQEGVPPCGDVTELSDESCEDME